MPAPPDRVAVADLSDRYGISRSVLYGRINALQIEPAKLGRRTYVSAEQLALLDALHDHLKQGGATAEFLEQQGLLPLTEAVSFQQHQNSSTSPCHWMERLRFLEEAYQHRWLLSTSQLAELLDMPVEMLLQENGCQYYGFQFTRAGMNGAEIAWKVTKQ